MVRDTVAVDTFARLAISRMFISQRNLNPFLLQHTSSLVSGAIVRLHRAPVCPLARRSRVSPKIPATIVRDGFSRLSRRRARLQSVSRQGKPPKAAAAGSDQLWVNRQRLGVRSWRGHAKIHICIQYILLALAEPGRGFVSPIRRARNSVREFALSGNVEDVVV